MRALALVLVAGFVATACRSPLAPRLVVELVESVPLGTGIPAIAVADFDRDGRADVFLTKPEMAVWVGADAQRLVHRSAVTQGKGTPFAGDFDGDGRPDVVLAWSEVDFPLNGRVLLGNGDGTLPRELPFENHFAGGVAAGAADVDGDLRTDVVAADAHQVFALLSQPDGRPVLGGAGPLAFVVHAVDDLDGDGRADLAGRDAAGALTLALGAEGARFAEPTHPRGDRCDGGLVIADLDRDGRPDLAAGNASGTWAVWRNLGSAMVAPVAQPETDALPHAADHLQVGDFDRDGLVDLAVAAGAPRDRVPVSVLFGAGGGRFGEWVLAEAQGWSARVHIHDMRAADVDGRGPPEIVLLRSEAPDGCLQDDCRLAFLDVYAAR